MFPENYVYKKRRFFKTAKVLTDVFFVLGLIASFTCSIVYAIELKNGLYLLIFPSGAGWIFVRLRLSLCSDVKFIRNKLYENSNNDLKEFLDEEYKLKGRYVNSAWESKYIAKEVERLNRLLDCGAISEEEYNREIRKLLDE